MRFVFCLLILFVSIHADVLKENYVTVTVHDSKSNISILWDFESDNLQKLLDIDDNNNSLISWKELQKNKDKIIKFVQPHFKIYIDDKECTKTVKDYQVHRRGDQSFIKLYLELSCREIGSKLKVDYDLFFDMDSAQKAFFKFDNNQTLTPFILSTHKREFETIIEKSTFFKSFKNFLVEGIWHIWIGFDHILFLLMLLLPCATPVKSFKPTLKEVFYIVTAFSAAHSITLSLSVLEIVDFDEKLIEVCIALSVLLTALNNIFNFYKGNLWRMAFGFGLIHGFGFAFVLKELMLESKSFAVMLFGFNIGVEIGQLIIVASILPIIFFLRKTLFYKYVLLQGLSILTAIISIVWVIQRAF